MEAFQLLFTSIVGLLCILLGALAMTLIQKYRLGGIEKLSQEILLKADQEAAQIRRQSELALKQNQLDQQREFEQTWQIERRKIQREEERIKQKEDKLETRIQTIDKKISEVEKREVILNGKLALLEDQKKEIQETKQKILRELETICGLSAIEARSELLNKITNEVKTDAANLIRRTKKEAEENAEREASTIIATAINRLAPSYVSETTINTVAIPNDEMKGRIIGREGRNIRALEQATGVNFVVDDTPGVVVISCFDPIRTFIAKQVLTELVSDGRIHPTRIEELVQKHQTLIQKKIKQYGEDAALRAGIMNLHPELIILLGRLKFRYSYGQNILDHSLEVCHLMGLMASELGLDVSLAKRIGLMHDMGKAVTHEMEGSHAIIGHDLAIKYGEKKEVANGIGCHHGEMEALTIEGSLCSAADAISASRPGARVEAIEDYVKRLKKLEELAGEFPGIERAYVLQAGRELRIVVLPDLIDDDGLVTLARNLTKRIENELNYPGKIKVSAIREKRIVEYAL